MPDADQPKDGETARNLPVPVQRPSVAAREGTTWLGRVMRSVFGWHTGSIRADLETVLGGAAGIETGFSPTESRLLRNILNLRERRINDVMVPRADIVAVQQDIGLGELIKIFQSAAHSRLVVFGETLDDPLGIVHIRDLIAFMANRAAVPAKANARRKKPLTAGLDFKSVDLAQTLSSAKIMRPLLFVPPSMPAIDLLAKMQATHLHLALVIDEYGGTDGLVSIEDIVEQVVGEIDDEHDEASIHTVLRQPDGSYIANGRATLDDVIASVGAEFDVGDAGRDIDTLGGYVVTQVGRVPVRGEIVPGPGAFEFEVLDADPRRIKRIRIARNRKAAPPRRRDGEPPPTTAPASPDEAAPRASKNSDKGPS